MSCRRCAVLLNDYFFAARAHAGLSRGLADLPCPGAFLLRRRRAREDAVNTRMPRSIYRRMEQLESRLAPATEPVIFKIQFVSADRSVVKEFETRPHKMPRPERSAVRSYR
jgi:hypothetical protein